MLLNTNSFIYIYIYILQNYSFTRCLLQDGIRPFSPLPSDVAKKRLFWFPFRNCLLQWNLDKRKAQGSGKTCFLYKQVRYIEVLFLFHMFYYYWGKENRSLYRGGRYIEVSLYTDGFYMPGFQPSEEKYE